VPMIALPWSIGCPQIITGLGLRQFWPAELD
jgi:hypothetical protein